MDYIFDIDGTLLDISHRLKFITLEGSYLDSGKKDWKSFRDPKQKRWDQPILPTIKIMDSLIKSGHRILVSTGRQESEKEDTIKSLRPYMDKDPISIRFYMRSQRDRRQDYLLKADHLDKMRDDGYDPQMVFEDRPTVITMWRLKGLLVADVSDPEKGNF